MREKVKGSPAHFVFPQKTVQLCNTSRNSSSMDFHIESFLSMSVEETIFDLSYLESLCVW